MSFEDLLAWIRSGRAFRSSPEDLLRIVDMAFESLTEDDPLYQPLADSGAHCSPARYLSQSCRGWPTTRSRQNPSRCHGFFNL